MNNYVVYIDTDSVFIMLGKFIEKFGFSKEKWDCLDQKTKTDFLIRLSKHIEKNVNERSYRETQLIDYNSVISDFSIKLKQEIVCRSALFLAPKMYAFHVVNVEGYDADDIDAKGIEIVRSSSPSAFRTALKDILKNILHDNDDNLKTIIDEYKRKFRECDVEEISVNIGINGLDKYIDDDFNYKKGTPYHIKGVANYKRLLKLLKISHKYPELHEGDKCKSVYVKKNIYNIDILTFHTYPKAFIDVGIIPDYDIMIEKYFINKIKILLTPIGKESILKSGYNNVFF